ncbi:hypothetical protein CTAYLR_005196 [Chrysophaeum taylorii]|uniref:Ankyrin repeat domain containing protein n=1 Tax=Chrysophaeum taylorii TaxID=2483200 RepID=A0AAD7UJ99_9STRA|nr:hypothetical protein CTAYLR_005179 [Chrysophaeum taylorii]KAJ8614162.1 hypothetical protein CTAYLR_005196 [Chrysophaeum taylorii]
MSSSSYEPAPQSFVAKHALRELVDMRARVMLNGVEDIEELEAVIEAKEAWVFGLLEGVSHGALVALSRRRIETQEHLVEISKLFDKVGVEQHVRELLVRMVPGRGYDPDVDENVRLPRGVSSDSDGTEEELAEFVRLGAIDWVAMCLHDHAGLGRHACRVAAEAGSLEVLSWARARGYAWDERTCSSAAEGGHLDVLKWARQHGCPWDVRTCTVAAASGRLDVLKWARDNDCPWDAWTCAEAARFGHLEVLQWARNNGCPWNDLTCSRAAHAGHLQILKWARERGCPWNELACTQAALGGHLDLLEWARRNGCPWDEATCSMAARAGHLHVLKWAHANGCPWDEWTCTWAALFGNLRVLEWARQNDCPWDKSKCEAATDADFQATSREVREWAHEEEEEEEEEEDGKYRYDMRADQADEVATHHIEILVERARADDCPIDAAEAGRVEMSL